MKRRPKPPLVQAEAPLLAGRLRAARLRALGSGLAVRGHAWRHARGCTRRAAAVRTVHASRCVTARALVRALGLPLTGAELLHHLFAKCLHLLARHLAVTVGVHGVELLGGALEHEGAAEGKVVTTGTGSARLWRSAGSTTRTGGIRGGHLSGGVDRFGVRCAGRRGRGLGHACESDNAQRSGENGQ